MNGIVIKLYLLTGNRESSSLLEDGSSLKKFTTVSCMMSGNVLQTLSVNSSSGKFSSKKSTTWRCPAERLPLNFRFNHNF